jgi:hypothetical protein
MEVVAIVTGIAILYYLTRDDKELALVEHYKRKGKQLR